MTVTLKKNISPAKIIRMSRAIAKKILKVSANPKLARKLAKRFVMKVLKNPKATRSMKVMAIKVLKAVKSHKKTAPRRHVIHHAQHQFRPNHHKNKKSVKKIVGKIANKILKKATNLKHAARLAKTLALKTLRNPSATLKQKKAAILVFRKVKKMIKNHKKNSLKKAIRFIPGHISEVDIKKVSSKILKSIKQLTKHHSIDDLKKVTQKISNIIMKKSDSAYTSKQVIASMIKKVVNNPHVATATKQMLNNIAAIVIQKSKVNKKH